MATVNSGKVYSGEEEKNHSLEYEPYLRAH
uniref:Uncharacterized protein n=1 Tax=Arundo donax TaxID=35708 RepID=A0A0A9AZJ3_ARUDO